MKLYNVNPFSYQLDASDMDDQVYRDNGDILIQFSRDRIEDVRSLLNKFQ